MMNILRATIVVWSGLLVAAATAADRQTPFSPGEIVTVLTAARAATGELQISPDPNWIVLRELPSRATISIPLRAVEMIRQPAAPQLPEAEAAAERRQLNKHKYVVYVHGICEHKPGFSDRWWTALKRHVDVPDGNRHEVVWSDIVNREATMPPAEAAQVDELSRRIKETLRARAIRQHVDALGTESLERAEPEAILDRIPGAACIDDFVSYLLIPRVRTQTLARFEATVRPLLQKDNARVEVISHSWGTVVAYEGLRRMEQESFDGRVHNLFTVGSALSIDAVRASLLSAFQDLRKPRIVNSWHNLDARFDIVGGYIPGEVDDQRLGLRAVGCPWIPNPTCSHSSYFEPQNLAVNRDIFGRAILSP